MSVESDVQTLLASLVGGRCYPLVNPAKVVGTSYITYQVISGNDLLLSSTGEDMQLQVDIFGTTYDSVKTLAAQAKTAMLATGNFAAVLTNKFDGFEEVTQEYRVTLEFDIFD